MLSYGLRLNVALFPFLLPIVVVAAVVYLCTGHHDDAAWLGAIAALEILGYGIAKFWMSTIEEGDAREWQRLSRNSDE